MDTYGSMVVVSVDAVLKVDCGKPKSTVGSFARSTTMVSGCYSWDHGKCYNNED